MKQCNKMKMVFVMCASAFVIQSVVASDEEVKIPTLQLVKQVWSVNYQYPGEKFFAVEWLFNALAKYPDAQDEADMAAVFFVQVNGGNKRFETRRRAWEKAVSNLLGEERSVAVEGVRSR